jgi:beta-glucosidase
MSSRRSLLGSVAILTILSALLVAFRTERPIYRIPGTPIEKRVEDLLARMTPEERADLISGDVFETRANNRLGIPSIKMADGPMGVRWYTATAFPASIALAATWDTDLVQKVGDAIARELRSQGRNMLLAPCVNIQRVPLAGRNFESYGEDPFLAARMAVAYIRGVQGQGVIASVKHFAANNQEKERNTINVKVDERVLHEIYFPAFKAAVQEAGVWSVMSAYNKINGAYCSENSWLLNEILKKRWGFQGFVVSDWGAVQSTVPTANGGCDLEMPTGKFMNGAALLREIAAGTIAQATIDEKVRRILRAMFTSGLFDRKLDAKVINPDFPVHAMLSYRAATESTVLLKNEGKLLPLDPAKIHSVAVIGPNAAVGRVGGGGAALVNPPYVVSPLEGLRTRLGKKLVINYSAGMIQKGDLFPIETEHLKPPDAKPGEHGLLGEYFSNPSLEGSPIYRRVDPQIDFRWGSASPAPRIPSEKFSVRWTGTLRAPKTGTFYFDGFGDDGVRLILDGKVLFDSWGLPRETYTAEAYLEEGHDYSLRYEFYQNISAATARLGWREKTGSLIPAAVEAAAKSDVALVFVGLSDYFESETFDRTTMALPEGQDELIQAIVKANPKTIVIVNSGSPVLMSKWIDSVPGVVMNWYPGQEHGHAIAAVLSGDKEPGGRLPFTLPKSWEDCAAWRRYPGENGVVPYDEGLFVGYRHFDKNNLEPLFPFGHGLSYATFAYSEPKLRQTPGIVEMRCVIKNTGNHAGEEVVQLYVSELTPKVARPPQELKTFRKLRLMPGEKQQITFTLGREAFSFYDPVKADWAVEAGDFEILVGRSSRDIKLRTRFTLEP